MSSEYKPGQRVQTVKENLLRDSLERQLIMCELKGLSTKANLLRSTLRGGVITQEVEQKQPELRGEHV